MGAPLTPQESGEDDPLHHCLMWSQGRPDIVLQLPISNLQYLLSKPVAISSPSSSFLKKMILKI